MDGDALTLRPAGPTDAEQIAELIVQLYYSEAPQAIYGSRAGQLELFRYLIAHELATGQRGRYVAVTNSGIVGTASVRYAGQNGAVALPPGVFRVAVQALGFLNTLRMFGSLLQAALTPDAPIGRAECYIYSVVVDAQQRNRGIGRTMMLRLEDDLRRRGIRRAYLRVVSANHGARRLYERLGYRFVSRTPPWAARIVFPTDLMRKEFELPV